MNSYEKYMTLKQRCLDAFLESNKFPVEKIAWKNDWVNIYTTTLIKARVSEFERMTIELEKRIYKIK